MSSQSKRGPTAFLGTVPRSILDLDRSWATGSQGANFKGKAWPTPTTATSNSNIRTSSNSQRALPLTSSDNRYIAEGPKFPVRPRQSLPPEKCWLSLHFDKIYFLFQMERLRKTSASQNALASARRAIHGSRNAPIWVLCNGIMMIICV